MGKKSSRGSNNIDSNNKQYLRDKIISGAKAYQHKKDFKHLTGIHSDLNDERFFENSALGILSENNIFETQHYNYQTLKQKADRIEKIEKLIYENVEDSLFMLNLHTNTCDFPIAIKNSNSNTCIGFIDNDNHARTLRKYTNSNICKSEKKFLLFFKRICRKRLQKCCIY